ncbi:hypothetical protein HYPSUDRAFT_1085312 [Hypholoma sublateritium FD-334 SS-4]|uniref:Uncharacterized protein n=1 Tax=Hypholoma sublateritium (strain FD-334 SS-4) TaxID=945553 RepID=A0A0D2L510_HYPSF|nr:hypothetical protein HYPSUDRAFT_1085312 [Hypholoma sublateritium FD-334 SS-4]
MDQSTSFQSLLFPSKGDREPFRIPHPEVYMKGIAENLGPRAWKYLLVETIDGMTRKFAMPYIIFYPVISQHGKPFPVNETIREIQGKAFRPENAWRGDIVVSKYCGNTLESESMIETTLADFPILKNYFLTYGSPEFRATTD